MDSLASHPLALWLNIWVRPGIKLSKEILKDCLSLDHALHIPWLKYISVSFQNLRRGELFSTPEGICKADDKRVKGPLFKHRLMDREGLALANPCAQRHFMLKTVLTTEQNLLIVKTRLDRFLLTRF